MLTMNRKVGDVIYIGEAVVTIQKVGYLHSRNVELGIEAPKHVKITWEKASDKEAETAQ